MQTKSLLQTGAVKAFGTEMFVNKRGRERKRQRDRERQKFVRVREQLLVFACVREGWREKERERESKRSCVV